MLTNHHNSKADIVVRQQNITKLLGLFGLSSFFFQVILLNLGIFSISQAQTYLRQDFETPFAGAITLTSAMSPAGSATSIPANQNWSAIRTIIRHDGFPDGLNSGTGNDQDWERNVNTGTATWSLTPTSAGTRPDAAVSGTGVLWFNNLNSGSIAGEYMRTLLSPTLNLTTATSPYARFSLFLPSDGARVPIRVVASKDNGTTWKSIMIIPGGFANTSTPISSSPWQQVNVIIPAEFRANNVKIGIEASPDGQIANIWIDDFVVEEFTPTTITSAVAGDWNTAATWTGGVIPNANNHVVIAHAVTTNNIAAMTRCQNLMIQATGTLTMPTTTFAQLMHVMGNLTVDIGGNGNFLGSTTAGKLLYVGGNVVNNGNLNFGIPPAITTQSRSGLYFCGGSAATYSGTGTVGIPTNRTIPAIMHNNPSGVTYNAPLVVASQCMLYAGDVNPNGNLTLGQNIAAFDFTMYKATGNLTARPIWGALGLSRLSNLRYVSTNETLLTKKLIQTGHEVAYNGTSYVVTGSLFVSTFDNIELTFPMSIGSGVLSGGFWTMARGIIYSTPTNLLTINALSNAAMTTTGSDQSLYSSGAVNNHGSYVIGTLRINFGTGFLVSRLFPMGIGGNFCTPTRNSNAFKGVIFTNSANWANQSVLVSLESNAPTGNVNTPLLALASTISYRVQDIGATPLTPATSNINFVGVNTEFGNSSNNLQGDGANLRIAQSLTNIAGTWTNRSTSGSTAGNIINYTNYTVNTAASAHLPIATNGEFFTFASISPTCTGTPAPANTVSTATTVGFGGSVKLSLQNATAGIGLAYQWQNSVDNGMNFNDVIGEINATYIATNITQGTQYRCRVTCVPTALNAISNPITVNILAAPTATNGSACGSAMTPVAVSLQATATTGTLNWYQTATSTTVLGIGTPFLTPPIGAATDFFVNEQRNSTTIGAGLVDNVIATAFAASPAKGQALVFTTLSSGTLNSVAVYPAAAGTSTIQLYNAAGGNAIGTPVVATFTLAQVGVKTLVPLNINVPFAGTYRLVNENIGADIALGQISLLSPSTQYPFVNADGLLAVIASATTPAGAFNTNIYNSFFDINFTSLALSARARATASLFCPPPPPPSNISQTITFDSIPNRVFSNQLVEMLARASSTLPVTFTVESGNATLAGQNFLTLTGLGEILVTASQAGGFANNVRYLAATPVTRRFRVIAASQTLTGFETITDRPWNSANFQVRAITNSNLPITFAVTEGANIAEIINGNIVKLKSAIGKVTVTATQAGNATTNAATPIVRSFNVTKADQVINSIANLPILTYRVGLTQTLVASATSDLPVVASIVSGNATITNNVVSFTSAGTVVVRYAQAGNDLWNPATSVERTIVVNKANQDIILTSAPNEAIIGTPQTVVASATSGLPVTMRVISGTATINGLVVTPTDGESVVIELNQAGNENFNAAIPVRFTMIIIPTLTLTSISGTKFCGGAIITVNFAVTGAFAGNNRMSAYLSDANGVFTNDRRLIGTVDVARSGIIVGTIPANIPSGTGYKVRLEALFPRLFSVASVQTLELNAVPEVATISQDGAALVSSVATGVQWFANGVAISGATSQKFTPTAAQIMANPLYSVVITNASGCTSVSGFANYQPPVVTGIDNPALSAKLSVYPNPTDNKITVELGLENASKVGIKLTDAAGRMVFNETVSPNGLNFKHDIDMKDLASGVYMLMVNVEGKTAVKRIVKQ